MNINQMAERAHTINESKGFNDGWKNEPDQILVRLALVHSEASEAVEAVRDGEMEVFLRADGKPDGFPIELADIVIRAVTLAKLTGVDIESAIEMKLKYNATRPHNHGRAVKVGQARS